MATIAENLERIQQAKADIKSAIEAKGVTVPSSATIDTYDDYVAQISGGGGSTADTAALKGLIERTATNIDIPSGTTSIGDRAFYNCIGLTSVTIPDSVTSIDTNAFSYCGSLTSVTIPDSVTSIYDRAFSSCLGLQSITVEATTPPTLGTSVFNGTNDCPIYVPLQSVSAYQSASGWSNYASRIHEIGYVHHDDGGVSGDNDW